MKMTIGFYIFDLTKVLNFNLNSFDFLEQNLQKKKDTSGREQKK